MDCLSPVSAWSLGVKPNGKMDLRFNCKFARPADLLLPCGKCSACRQNKRVSWVNRCTLELLRFPLSSFLTLTYDDSHLPLDRQVHNGVLSSFFKRLRNFKRDYKIGDRKSLFLRYFAVGEYGSKFGRPHYHAIVFGVDFLDPMFKPYMAASKDGYPIFSSRLIERYWPYGFISFDEVTPCNVRYVAKYVSKSDGCFVASKGLGRSVFVDVSWHGREQHMSPKPLLFSSGYNDKFCVQHGKSPQSFPRFALRYLEKFYPDVFLNLKATRKNWLVGRNKDFTKPSVRDLVLSERLRAEIETRSYDKNN